MRTASSAPPHGVPQHTAPRICDLPCSTTATFMHTYILSSCASTRTAQRPLRPHVRAPPACCSTLIAKALHMYTSLTCHTHHTTRVLTVTYSHTCRQPPRATHGHRCTGSPVIHKGGARNQRNCVGRPIIAPPRTAQDPQSHHPLAAQCTCGCRASQAV